MFVLAVIDKLIAQTGILDLLGVEFDVAKTVTKQMTDNGTGVRFTGPEGALNPNALTF